MFNLKKILITGGSGFIGSNLIGELLKKGCSIINVDRGEPKIKVKTKIVDITQTDFSFLDNEDFDYVVHLAALSNNRLCSDVEQAFNTNVNGTFRLLNKLSNKNIKKIIFMSSVVVYSNNAKMPIKEDEELDIYHDNYSYTKGIDEEICEHFRNNFNLPIITFRLSNIYGPYQEWRNHPNLVPQIISQAILNKKIELWNETPVRDWIFIDDATEAIIKALDSEYAGIMNLGTGKGKSVGEIAKIIAKLSNSKVISMNKEITGPLKVVCDISRIKKEIGWFPKIELEEGLKRTYSYYKKVIK